jgi:hypothetical protein
MKTYRVLALLLLAAGLTIGCEDSSDGDDDDNEPFINFTLADTCAEELPNGLQITFDGEVIGTVMPGSHLSHDTTEGEHTWSAPAFGTHTIVVPESGIIQPLFCE